MVITHSDQEGQPDAINISASGGEIGMEGIRFQTTIEEAINFPVRSRITIEISEFTGQVATPSPILSVVEEEGNA